MTIESITGRSPNPVPIKTSQKTEIDGDKKGSVKNTEKEDSVAITTVAQEIKKAFESSSAASAVDIDRVSSVKKALADGSYPIDADRIAKKMIQFEISMP